MASDQRDYGSRWDKSVNQIDVYIFENFDWFRVTACQGRLSFLSGYKKVFHCHALRHIVFLSLKFLRRTICLCMFHRTFNFYVMYTFLRIVLRAFSEFNCAALSLPQLSLCTFIFCLDKNFTYLQLSNFRFYFFTYIDGIGN